MTTPYEFLQSVMKELCTAAACGAAYPSWPDDFARKELREVWGDALGPTRKQRMRRVTIAELQSLDKDQRWALGIGNWDESLRVIPLWMWNYIADGETLTCIDGTTAIKGAAEIDLDVRFGCIAHGFKETSEAQAA